MNLTDHRTSNQLCRTINALWKMRGYGGIRVHRSASGFVIEGATAAGSFTNPETFDGDDEIRQFVHLARPYADFNTVGTGNDWVGTFSSTGPWGTAGDPVQFDELYRAVLRFGFDAYIERVSLYFLEADSNWSIDNSTPIFRGAIFSTDNDFFRHDVVPVGTLTPQDDIGAYAAWKGNYPNATVHPLLYQMYLANAAEGQGAFANLDRLYGFDFSGPWVDTADPDLFQRTNPLAIWLGNPPFYLSSIRASRLNAEELTSAYYVNANQDLPLWFSINALAAQTPFPSSIREVSLPIGNTGTARVMLVVDVTNQYTGAAETYSATISLEQYNESTEVGSYDLTQVVTL